MNIKRTLDPCADREAEKYSNPIPSREYILSLLKKSKQSMTRQKITNLLGLEGEEQIEALRRRLRAMCRDGQLIWSRNKGYNLVKNSIFLKGKISGVKETFGWVTPEDGSPNLFLSAYQMRQVFLNDRVLVRITQETNQNKRFGSIVEILERHTEQLVGYYSEENNTPVVTPTHPSINHLIHIPPGSQANAKPGQIVLLEIVQQPDLHHPPKGRIIQILGDKNTKGIESLMAIQMYRLPNNWSKTIQNEVKRLQKQKEKSDAIERIDLRSLPFVTIDGEDSKDFDDAVYCYQEKKQWRLLVAIADVSHFVTPGTAMDKEAYLRGNSVYLPHQVVPMLPDLLSNDWCSLKPKVDRFCLVCDMQISLQGKLLSYKFYPATIHSQARLTYNEVAEYLQTDQYPTRHQAIADPVKDLHTLYQILFQARKIRGAIDLELPEAKILLDAQGKINSIQPNKRNVAHRLIEECMLMANVATARFLLANKIPSLFRIHEAPSPEKLNDFKDFTKRLGISFGSWLRRTPKSIDFSNLLEKSKDHTDNELIQTMVLRTMNQAIYSPNNKGHFGLAYSEYTHFTSPIRRYSDLIIHRIIYYLLAGHQKNDIFYYDMKSLEGIGTHCSMTERRADEATRHVTQVLQSQLMESHLGDCFLGKITHVTSFGFFVSLTTNLVEGLVHISSMQHDYYSFDAKKMLLQGKDSHKIYRLGDIVRIKVTKVDTITGLTSFELFNE